MHFLFEYGLFAAKLISVVIAILITISGIIAISTKGKSKTRSKLSVTPVNDKYSHYKQTIIQSLSDKGALKQLKKQEKKVKGKKSAPKHKKLFVLNFHGDVRASSASALREEVTAILLAAKKSDEVLVCLESGGGLVNAYGLAASQLHRIRDAKIKLTVAVDKIAASGGYMMACVADEVIAAPFAVIGSIGVLAQIPNFHRYLKDKHIDFEQITAGEYKRTLSMFGKNTDQGREKMQQEVNETHELFKDFIRQHRPQLDLTEVSTGEHWFGQKALDLKLVDRLMTSDDYLLHASKTADVFEIQYKTKKTFQQRLTQSATNLWNGMLEFRT